MSGTFSLPNFIFDDPWFTPERMWRLAWIAKHVRWTDNCVVKRGQESWALRTLAEKWNCTVKVVRTTLEGLESRALIRIETGKIKGKVQNVITYLFSSAYSPSKQEEGTQRARKGHAKGTSTNTGNPGKEDSCSSQAPNANEFWPDQEEPIPSEAGGADHSPEPAGAGPSEAPGADPSGRVERADLPKNSAQKGSAARKRRVPDDWRPKDATVAWARNGKIGAADPQIEEQLDAFRDHHIAKGSTFADLDRAFQTWMRNAKRYGHLDGPKKTYAQQNREAEFSI